MNEIELIIDRLKTTFDGGAFHGPNFMDNLKEVDAEEARRRPIEERHTIWEIVNHCTFWIDAAVGALKGKKMPPMGEDWPLMGETESEWTNAIENLRKAHEELVKSISNFDESRLEDKVRNDYFRYTYRKMLHGIADHNTYHSGQIAVFRKKR